MRKIAIPDPQNSLPRPSVTQGLRIKRHMLGPTPRKKRWPDLEIEQILAWADAYRARRGRWPSGASGPVEEAPGETWAGVDSALRNGCRGFPGGSSLSRLLREQRRANAATGTGTARGPEDRASRILRNSASRVGSYWRTLCFP